MSTATAALTYKNPGEFAASPTLSRIEAAQVQKTQFDAGYRAAQMGRQVGTHEPVATQRGARHFEQQQAQ